MDRAEANPLDCAEIVAAKLLAVHALCRQFGVSRLDLFGSAATGRFDPASSDLDFLVEFEELPPGQYSKRYFGLLFALEELFGRSIDLLTASSVVNPYLRRQIESEKYLIFPPRND